MIGMLGNVAVAFKIGGILTLMTSLILLIKGWQAPTRPYKNTEVWIMLEPGERPHASLAQTLIGQTLKRTYLTFALHSALLACGFFTVSLIAAFLMPQWAL